MKLTRRRVAIVMAATLAGAGPAAAQTFPDKPVRVIMPYPAGVGPDIMMRLIADKLKQYWGQGVIVENRPGGNGWIAAEAVKKAAPNGYTLLLTDNLQFGLQPYVMKTFPFDAHRDFLPVAPLYSTNYFVVVPVNSKWNNVGDLLAAAKAANAAGKTLSYGSSGYASHMHLGGVMLERPNGVQMTHVPYKETSQVFVSVASGDLDWAFGSPSSTEAMYKAGKIKYLAISGRDRLSTFPDVPTVAQAGGPPDFELRAWVAAFAPAGTPAAVIETLNAGITRALSEPDVSARMVALGAPPWKASPQELAAAMKEDEALFGGIAKRENLRID